MTPKLRVGILISGRGSNMAALIEAAKDPAYPAEVAVVLSNRSNAGGLKTAQASGIPAKALAFSSYANDAGEFDSAVDRELRAARVDLICLAGYMRLLTPAFLKRWEGRVLNIHPSLLPAYKGLDTHARAIADRQAEAGCSVHVVIPELDAGPIIAQAKVRILPGDTPETLAARVLTEEHKLYPEAVRLFAESMPGAGARRP